MANRELMITLGLDTSSYSQNVKRAKDLNKELDSSFKLLSSSSEKFEDSIEGLSKKQDYLEEKLKVATGLTQVYSDRLKESQKALHDATQKSAKHKAEIENLNKSYEEGSIDQETFKEKLKSATQQFDKAEKAIVTHNKRILEAKNGYNLTQVAMQDLTKQSALVAEKLNNLKADEGINALKNNIKGLKDNLSSSKEAVDGFSNTLTGLKRTQEVYAQTLKDSKTLLNSYGEEIKKATQYVDKYQKELDATTKELKEWEQILDSIDINEGDFKEASKLFDEARVEVERLRAEYTQINTAMYYHTKRLSEMKSGYKTTEKSIANFDKELGQVDNNMKKINQQRVFDNLDNQIKHINDYIEVLNSKLEMANSTMKNFGKTKEGLNTKTEIYKETVLQLKKQLELLNTTLDNNGKELTQLKEEQDLVAQSINRVRMEMLKVDKDSPEYEKQIIALSRLEKSYDELEKEIRDFQGENHRLQSEINTTTAQINNMARETNELAKNFKADWFKNVGGNFSRAGQAISGVGQSLMGMSVALGGAQALIVSAGIQFETSMSKVSALSGVVGEELDYTEKRVREIAKESVYSASETADALGYLALAGYNVERDVNGASEALDALPHILNTAMAGAMDLATASDKATDAFASLGEQGRDLPSMLNMVAQASASSNTSVEQMLDAFIKVGGQIENLNIPLETASSMLGVLANRGIKAEQAGNSLNSILINMTKEGGEASKAMSELGVSMFDETGNIRNVEEVFLDLSKALSGLSEQKQVQLINMIGGKTQAKTLQKLLQGMVTDTGELTEEYKQLKAEIEKAPDLKVLESMGNTMTDNLGGDLKMLGAQIEETFLSVFEKIEPQLRETVQKITKTIESLTDKFNEWFSTLSKEEKQKFVDFVLGLTSFLVIAPPLLMAIGAMSSGIGAIFTAIGWVIDIFPSFNKEVEGAGGQVTGLNKKMQKLVDDIPKMINGVKSYGTTIGSFFSGFGTTISGWLSGLGTVVAGSSIWSTLQGAISTLGGWLVTAFGTVFSSAGLKFVAIGALIVASIYLIYKAIKYLYKNWDSIVEKMKKAWSTAMEWISKKAEWIKEKMESFVEKIKKGFESLVDFFKDLPSKIWSFIKSLPSMISRFFNKVIDTILKSLAMTLANGIGFIITIGKQIYDAFAGIFKSLGGVVEVFVGIFTLNFDKIKEGVKDIFSGIWDIITDTFKNGWGFLTGAFENIMSIFDIDASVATQAIEDFFIGIWTKFTTWLSDIWESARTWFDTMIQQIPTWLASIGVAIAVWFTEKWNNFTTWLTNLWTSFTTWASNLWTSFTTWLSDMKNSFLTWANENWTKFTEWLGSLWTSFIDWCSRMKEKLIEWLTEFANDPIGFMKEFASGIASGLKEAWDKFVEWCSEMLTKLGTWFSELIDDTWTNIQEWASKFGDGVEKIFEFFVDLPSKLFNIGKEMIDNLWTGFKSKLSDFGGWVQEGVGNIVDKIFKSASPSVDAEVSYSGANTPTTFDALTNTPNYNSYTRESFADMGSLINGIFKEAFTLDNYKTNGGFYSPNSVKVSNSTKNNNSLLQVLLQQNQLLMQLLTNNTIEVGVNVDGRQIARASAKYIDKEIVSINKKKARLGGTF